MFRTLITPAELAQLQADTMAGALLVLDCSFELGDTGAGRRAYDEGHIPGAHYVHLEDTLSGPKTGRNGRHPLPAANDFVAAMAALGASRHTQVVACDNAGGMYASRLWWLMRWLGHEAVAVLDGGLGAWKQAGLPVTRDVPPTPVAGDLSVLPSLTRTVDYATLRANIGTPARLVVDARAPDRYRGENETIDPVGGHIPGANHRLFRDNLDATGAFKPAATLREEFRAVLDGRQPAELVSQCGSGVTACHNLLALEIAGLPGAALYPGSWSEWCAQPDAPIATGAAP
ncbi:sulfurtransferase [Cupriavidus necator]|uniref:sulfurtransferase n=1 Tax=Cupriavidus necator TaxID=106590 RepID=UPI0027D7CFA9|nr:sulfurtransferase [Cupriavidus necator]